MKKLQKWRIPSAEENVDDVEEEMHILEPLR